MLVAALCLLAAADVPPAPRVPAGEVAAAQAGILEALARARRGEPPPALSGTPTPLERFLAAYALADDDTAWALFKRLQVDAPLLPYGETGMGRVYVRWRIRDQAARAFERALQLEPRFVPALLERAEGERGWGDLGGARRDVAAALALEPADARALVLHAQIEEQAGAPRAALRAAYAAALAQAPELPDALAALARLEEDAAARAALLERLVRAAPRDAAIWQELGAARRAAGDLSGAASALEAAAALGEPKQELVAALVALDRELGRGEQEEQLLRRLRRAAPKDRSIVLRLIELHRATGDTGALEGDATALLGIDPQDAGAHLLLAERRGQQAELVAQLDELRLAARGAAHPDAPDAPLRAREAEKTVRGALFLPSERLKARDIGGVYAGMRAVLNRAVAARRGQGARVSGRYTVRVGVTADGHADDVQLVEDAVGDPALAACLVVTLREAGYPKAAGRFTFKFLLAPPWMMAGHGGAQ